MSRDDGGLSRRMDCAAVHWNHQQRTGPGRGFLKASVWGEDPEVGPHCEATHVTPGPQLCFRQAPLLTPQPRAPSSMEVPSKQQSQPEYPTAKWALGSRQGADEEVLSSSRCLCGFPFTGARAASSSTLPRSPMCPVEVDTPTGSGPEQPQLKVYSESIVPQVLASYQPALPQPLCLLAVLEHSRLPTSSICLEHICLNF